MRAIDKELISEFEKLGYKTEWYGMGKEFDWEHHREIPCASYSKEGEDLHFSILVHELSDEYKNKSGARYREYYRIINGKYIENGIEEGSRLYKLYKRQIDRLLEMQRNYKEI